MHAADRLGAGKVRDGAGDPLDARIAARGEAHRFGSLCEQLAPGFVRSCVDVQQIAVKLGVAAGVGALEPGNLQRPRPRHPRGHLVGTFCRRRKRQIRRGDRIDLDMEVNRAAKDRPKVEEDKTQTLVSAEVTTARPSPTSTADVFGASTPKPKPAEEKIDVASVFGKLKELKSAD